MANATGKNQDKRTAEQRKNDAAQKARPKGAQDTTFVTTGLHILQQVTLMHSSMH